jgi:hypothetical protein
MTSEHDGGPRRLYDPPIDPSRSGRYRVSGWRGVWAALAGLGVVVVLAGCGGASQPGAVGAGSTPPGSPTAAAARSSPGAAGAARGSGAGVPDPNAPEVVAAGDTPDNQVFVPVTPAGAAFTVSVPQGWARSSDGGATVFTDKFNSVRIESRLRAVAPDVASVRAQDVPALQSSTPGFALEDTQPVRRSAGPAVLLTYSATSAPNAVTGKSVTEAVERYAFWRGGTEVVPTLAGPQGSDNVDPWRRVTDSLRWNL